VWQMGLERSGRGIWAPLGRVVVVVVVDFGRFQKGVSMLVDVARG